MGNHIDILVSACGESLFRGESQTRKFAIHMMNWVSSFKSLNSNI